MRQLKNRRRYYKYLFQVWLLMFAGFLILFVLSSLNFWILLLLFLICSFVWFLQSFTETIKIDSSEVVIEYYRFFSSKRIVMPTVEVDFKFVKTATFRGGQHFELRIFRKRKLIYTIDSRDGFNKEELESITQSS